MYSRKFYLSRVRQAKKLAALPENAGRKQAYLTLAANWQRMADGAPSAQGAAQKAPTKWEPVLHRAMRDAGLT